jgi:hypothetical protein
MITLLLERGQRLLFLPGIAVNRASGAYRGEDKTDVKDRAVIADQARRTGRSTLSPISLSYKPAPIVPRGDAPGSMANRLSPYLIDLGFVRLTQHVPCPSQQRFRVYPCAYEFRQSRSSTSQPYPRSWHIPHADLPGAARVREGGSCLVLFAASTLDPHESTVLNPNGLDRDINTGGALGG